MRLHLQLHLRLPACACTFLQLAATGKKKQLGCCSWLLGKCNSAGCSRFLSFRPGQLPQQPPVTPQQFPPILSCVPSQLDFYKLLRQHPLFIVRPSIHQRHHHFQRDRRFGFGYRAQWECSPTITANRPGLGMDDVPPLLPHCPTCLAASCLPLPPSVAVPTIQTTAPSSSMAPNWEP